MQMKLVTALTVVGLVVATPIERRQTGTSASEFSQGGCRPVVFTFARGSTEVGNLGSTVGPPTSDGLKRNFGANNVATEGINYAALLSTNALPGGTDAASAALLRNTLNAIARQCPNSVIVSGGYSQGAAVNHRAIESLSQAVKDQIAGVITYGDTQNQQDNGQIPNFPKSKVRIICNLGDVLCQGQLIVLPPHLAYEPRVPEAVAFLTQQIRAAQAKIKARNAAQAAEESAEAVFEGLKEEVLV